MRMIIKKKNDYDYHDCYHDHTASDRTAACLSLGEGDTVVMIIMIILMTLMMMIMTMMILKMMA